MYLLDAEAVAGLLLLSAGFVGNEKRTGVVIAFVGICSLKTSVLTISGMLLFDFFIAGQIGAQERSWGSESLRMCIRVLERTLELDQGEILCPAH